MLWCVLQSSECGLQEIATNPKDNLQKSLFSISRNKKKEEKNNTVQWRQYKNNTVKAPVSICAYVRIPSVQQVQEGPSPL